MDKKISGLFGENAVLKSEVAELQKSFWFHTDQWKSELFQNQKHQQQQQPVIPDLKEIKGKLKDLENRSRSNNLRIDGIIEEENGSREQSEKKLQEIINDQVQFEQGIEIEGAHRSGKKNDTWSSK